MFDFEDGVCAAEYCCSCKEVVEVGMEFLGFGEREGGGEGIRLRNEVMDCFFFWFFMSIPDSFVIHTQLLNTHYEV